MDDMLFGAFEKGSPEEKAASRRVAAEIRKFDRRRAAAVAVATQEYEETLATDDGPTSRQCMEYAVQVKRADDAYNADMMAMVHETFEAATGTSINALTAQVADKVREMGITGFTMDSEGDIVPMGDDGCPLDFEPEEMLSIAEPLLSIPGIVPPEIRSALRARCEAIRRECDGEPPDGEMDFLNGIDLDGEFKGTRDFDGGTE